MTRDQPNLISQRIECEQSELSSKLIPSLLKDNSQYSSNIFNSSDEIREYPLHIQQTLKRYVKKKKEPSDIVTKNKNTILDQYSSQVQEHLIASHNDQNILATMSNSIYQNNPDQFLGTLGSVSFNNNISKGRCSLMYDTFQTNRNKFLEKDINYAGKRKSKEEENEDRTPKIEFRRKVM